MKKILPLFMILILLITIFSGCVDNNEPTNDNDVDNSKKYIVNMNYPRDRLGLNEEGELAFSSAINTYSELRDNMSAEDARIALVNELNDGFENIKKASLSDDGYTIGLVFDDDTAALLVTYNRYYENNINIDTSSQFINDEDDTYPNLVFSSNMMEKSDESKLPITGVKAEESDDDGCEYVDFIVPQNRKVYYFRADYTNVRYTSFEPYMFTRNLFLGYDWSVNDIVEIHKKSWRDITTTPEDLLNMEGFGIIVYTGIGGYSDLDPKAIPGQYYIQCCSPCNLSIGQLDNDENYFLDAVGEDRFKQYISWRDQGRLILTGYERDDGTWITEYSMDVDIIKEEGKIDRGAMVFFNTGDSWRCKDIFLSLGAGCFIGWDGSASAYDGINPLINMFKNMIKYDEPDHISEAYGKLSKSFRESYLGGTLKVDDFGLDFYLPCFGKMTIDVLNPPVGTSYYYVQIYPYGTTYDIETDLFTPSFYKGEEFEYDGVSPINTTITITAKESSRTSLESSVEIPDFISTKNSQMTFTEWKPYGIILEADPITVESDGVSTSTITATLKTFIDGDVTKPTGDVLPCKEVEFFTSFGSFNGDFKVITGLDGQATIELKSDTDGIATVRAIVDFDGIESYKTQNITFGDVPYTFRLVSWDREDVYDPGYGEPRIKNYHNWRYWLAYKSIDDVEYYKITLKINGQEYVSGGFKKDQEYITDGKLHPAWDPDHIPANAIEDYNNGTRFIELGGLTHSGGSEGSYNYSYISEKQKDLLAFLEGCTFEIEAYTDY